MSGQLALGVKLRDSSVFASYFAGPNQAAVDALRAVRIAQPPTCIFLHGPIASGKSHLLQALCAHMARQGHTATYAPLASLAQMGPDVLSGYGELAYVCVDDIEAIAGLSDWEHALFRLHQDLDERQGHLVVAGALPPAASGIRLADLRSRLGGGLVLSLQLLNEEQQIAALQLRASIRGVDLPEEVAQLLLRRLPRDMESLCRFLDELDDASLAAQRRLTVPFVRSVLESR